MKLSGFSFVRNATRLYYPVKPSILSILDIVDEFVIAVGDNDEDDHTLQEIESIGSPKIKIIRTAWNLEKFPGGTEYAHQTDVAMQACTGDWLFYLQSDEVVHERHLSTVKNACIKYLDEMKVDGFLFDFKHFWGDYEHYHNSHAWYPLEIRIIRNKAGIHSWKDAQSFRWIPGFDGISYREKRGTAKLQVVKIDASIYHYGWVRPPGLMQKKRKEFSFIYRGKEASETEHRNEARYFDYGSFKNLKMFRGSHPAVMRGWIEKFDWKDKLVQTGSGSRVTHKHDQVKYRVLTFLEKKIFGGRRIGGFKNYKIIRP